MKDSQIRALNIVSAGYMYHTQLITLAEFQNCDMKYDTCGIIVCVCQGREIVSRSRGLWEGSHRACWDQLVSLAHSTQHHLLQGLVTALLELLDVSKVLDFVKPLAHNAKKRIGFFSEQFLCQMNDREF